MNAITPTGKKYIGLGWEACDALERELGVLIVRFPDDQFSAIDAAMVSNGEIVGLLEVKSRDCTEEQMLRDWRAEWLVSYDKVHRGRTLVDLLRVPMYAVIYCAKSGTALFKRIWTADGHLDTTIRVALATTKKSCVDASGKMESVAYVDISKARRVVVKKV